MNHRSNNITSNTRMTSGIIYATILLITSLHIGQGLIVHLRLNWLSAEKIQLNEIRNSCDDRSCEAEWEFEAKHKLSLLGNIMRQHSLSALPSGKTIYPVSHVRGTATDSWRNLRVYPTQPGVTYKLVAKKPAAVKMGYFVGILPRSSNHEGMLSIPDVTPTVSVITTLAGFGLLWLLAGAAFLAPRAGLGARRERGELISFTFSGITVVLATAMASGIFDSILPNGELRSRILRTAIISSTVLPISYILFARFVKISAFIFCISGVSSVVLLVNTNWDFIRAGIGYISMYSLTMFLLSCLLLYKNKKMAAGVILLALWDPLFMTGMQPFSDIPPMYLFQPVLVGAFNLIFADLGAVSVIALASKAYQRFTRDLILKQIDSQLELSPGQNAEFLSESIKQTLPMIAQLTGAGRVSVLLNLPSSRPITHKFMNDRFETHDDGKIPGAVTIRAFVYGDCAWFEPYEEFSNRLDLPKNLKTRPGKEYVCIAPIRVNHTNMGVVMLTDFDDEHISRSIKTGAIENDRESALLLIDTLEGAFSELVIHNLHNGLDQSTELMAKVREAISIASSQQEFLSLYCTALRDVTGLMVMIHQKIDDKGLLVSQSGLPNQFAGTFIDSPLNLSAGAKKAYGSTVTAFREKKSSYLKDWEEIAEKLHPKTCDLFSNIDAYSILAAPISSSDRLYVVTLISSRSQGARDPGINSLIESTEAVFDAAMTVLEQRSSVLALGKLANRLIGDDDIRDQVVSAAKEDQLPTIVGSARTSFLFLLDLVGSSYFEGNAEEKARAYGNFYDQVNVFAQNLLFGKVRKTIGDAIIITWDGSGKPLATQNGVVNRLMQLTAFAEQVAIEAGCKGVRSILHHGDYFFGLVGTSSFGQIDVIGRGIDQVCKLEGSMKTFSSGQRTKSEGSKKVPLTIKMSVSHAAFEKLDRVPMAEWLECGFESIDMLKRDPKTGALLQESLALVNFLIPEIDQELAYKNQIKEAS